MKNKAEDDLKLDKDSDWLPPETYSQTDSGTNREDSQPLANSSADNRPKAKEEVVESDVEVVDTVPKTKPKTKPKISGSRDCRVCNPGPKIFAVPVTITQQSVFVESSSAQTSATGSQEAANHSGGVAQRFRCFWPGCSTLYDNPVGLS